MKDIKATVVVNLRPSLSEIFNNLQKDARWGIKKAERENLTVEESENWDGFYPIYVETMKSTGIRFESLEHLKKWADVLFLCKKDEKIIGGSTLKVENNVPRLTRNASLKKFQHFQPNNLLYWACIKWSKENNYSTLDLGGWQINPTTQERGVNDFKERWGLVRYDENEYPAHKALGRKIIKKFKWLRMLNRKLKND